MERERRIENTVRKRNSDKKREKLNKKAGYKEREKIKRRLDRKRERL